MRTLSPLKTLRTLVVALGVAASAALTPGVATAGETPADGPTLGACGYAPLEDQTYSTWTGLPQDPARTPARGTLGFTLQTNHGDIPVVLDRALAPCTVQNFAFLTHRKYFDDTSSHRLTAYRTPPAALSDMK
jgi:peptidyl-prolyl cis-trans isomerase B (cyclophilin B)